MFLPSWYKFYYVLARSRYKFDRSREVITGYNIGGGHWRSVGDVKLSRSQKVVQMQNFGYVQRRESGFKGVINLMRCRS